jgi:hypothetical protein
MNADRYARLAAQVEHPESWRPVPGETLLGDVVRWELAVESAGKDGSTKTCDLLIVRTPEGRERSVWMWHAVLRYELVAEREALDNPGATAQPLEISQRKARPGDAVAINYVGKKPNQSGEGEIDRYRVAIESAPPSPENGGDHERDHAAPYDPATAPFPGGY